MFRINKFASLLTHTGYHNRLINAKIQRGWQHLVTTNRFYSDKGERDRSGACPPCSEEKKVCTTPKPVLPECVPKDPFHPCNQDFKPYPTDYDCPVPNRMNGLPPRQPNFSEHHKGRQKYYSMILALGTITLIATVYTMVKVLLGPEKKPVIDKLKRPKLIVKRPSISEEIPNKIPYLLIGGGTASFSAFRAIKSADPTAKVLVITSEGDYPYMRPPLSKEMWFNSDETAINNLTFKQWNGSERSLFYEPNDFYVNCVALPEQENGGVSVARGWSVAKIDVVEKKAFLEDGYEISYGKCLIATGAQPKNLHIFSTAENKIQNATTLFRDIFDFQELYHIAKKSKCIAVIGGGFLGSEIACAMSRAFKDLKVVQVFKESGNMGKILPEYLSLWTTDKVKKEGVDVFAETEVTGVMLKNNMVQLTLSNGEVLEANHTIVAVGAEANTNLAEPSNLEVHSDLGGYLVNTELQARSDLYIAGDCACFYDTKLGRRRVEHHDHAVVSGRLAGENMAGDNKPYLHQSMFWSDLGPDVGYEAIGIVDATLPTVGVFAKATDSDTPKAVVTATGEGIRSATEEEIKCTCGTESNTEDPKSSKCKKHFNKDSELKVLAAQQLKTKGDSKLEEDFGKGVIFYLRDDVVVGIVLWNVFNRMNIARQVLKDERKYDDLNEVAKLFNIHEE